MNINTINEEIINSLRSRPKHYVDLKMLVQYRRVELGVAVGVVDVVVNVIVRVQAVIYESQANIIKKEDEKKRLNLMNTDKYMLTSCSYRDYLYSY